MTWPKILVVLVIVFWGCYGAKTKNQFQTVDVGNLASHVYGTELILLENSYQEEKKYRFEDFFWTGSGDGSYEGDDSWDSENPSTIYQTKTVVSTVYLETPPTSHNGTIKENATKCSFNCDLPSIPRGEITPTPTLTPTEETSTEDDFFDADRQFWLLTVLKSDGKDPVIIDLKNSLAKLYKTAFQRQQERHLGITNRKKRNFQEDNKRMEEKPVKVYIHNVEKSKLNGNEKIQVLYHVSVSGKPVAAVTAAEDMSLVSDEEVTNELGYPFLIKAEPYLKTAEPQSLSRSENTWIFIGVSIVALLILLLIVAFMTLGFTKCKKQPTPSGINNRRQIFERGVGTDNAAFVHESTKTGESPTYINFRNQLSNLTVRSGIASTRQQSSYSSSSSSASLDISPLMGLKKQRTPPKKPPRPKAALNKTAPMNVKRIAPELFDSQSDESGSKINSPDRIIAENDSRIASPKSYLSMPSVKSFPRGNMPESLNKVLEPVSVLHLDLPDDDNAVYHGIESITYQGLSRYGSVGTVEDPGVVGPIVWSMHQKRLQQAVSVDEGIDDLKTTSNVSRMRKRFHDLLDDTFTLFGSRRETPVHYKQDPKATPIEIKSHSAANTRPNDEDLTPNIRPRPKTTEFRRIMQSPSSSGPRGAWSSAVPSPLVRPLSAGPVVKPRINVDHVLAEGKFKANDPAVPLIAAIKSEIEKCSLPGSTTDLKE